ncbi:MAG: efflux RND transporter permease subunit [Candidatus Eisenbacteria bacterium]|uniref:Efflux RND transporter permease subunit n=1 Tax=Eiseniibacteriota bacterium TaxID=2212470 RepID=A0A938BQD8_UNCEI|nr:efflux RND transporter permease subunit [Candidatus Eisenbacteria bacterium]
MLCATGSGAEVQHPLAVVLVGLATATLLTPIVLPTLYCWANREAQGAAPRGAVG